MCGPKAFEFCDNDLEYAFVEDLGRRTLVSSIVLRLFLALAWAVGWRKLPQKLWHEGPRSTSDHRYALCLGVWTFGAACQVVSALLLLRERKSSRHELLKAQSFVATITVAMVASMMLKHREAQTTLSLSVPHLLINGGYLVFEQLRFQVQLYLQALHSFTVFFVAIGTFLNTGDAWRLFLDLCLLTPLLVVCQLGSAALLELRARSYFLLQQKGDNELGSFWQNLNTGITRLKEKLQ